MKVFSHPALMLNWIFLSIQKQKKKVSLCICNFRFCSIGFSLQSISQTRTWDKWRCCKFCLYKIPSWVPHFSKGMFFLLRFSLLWNLFTCSLLSIPRFIINHVWLSIIECVACLCYVIRYLRHMTVVDCFWRISRISMHVIVVKC